jgi:hypothetical protein
MRVSKQTILTGCAAVAAAMAATIGANAAIDTGDADQPEPTRAVDQRLVENLGLFRGQQAGAAKEARSTQRDLLAAERGVNKGLARRALVTGGDSVLVSPTREGACLGTTRFGVVTCAETDQVLAGRTVGAIICSPHLPEGDYAIFGVLPDGVDEVAAEMSNGSTSDYRVTNNVLAIIGDKGEPTPKWFRFALDGVVQRVRSQLPPRGDLGC